MSHNYVISDKISVNKMNYVIPRFNNLKPHQKSFTSSQRLVHSPFLLNVIQLGGVSNLSIVQVDFCGIF